MRIGRACASLALTIPTILSLSCASTPAADAQRSPDDPAQIELAQAKPRRTPAAPGTPVEFSAPNTSVALLIRELNAASGRNLVLMNGLETTRTGPYDKAKRPAQEWADMIATDAGLRLDRLPAYDFIYPPGYETLTQTTTGGRLEATLAARRTSLHFDLDTPLVSALALLSRSLGTTIVADNVVADAHCGEVHLADVTVDQGLDALLKSARVANQSLRILSDTERTFLYAAGRPLRTSPLVIAAGETRPESLDRRMTLYLPITPTEPDRLSGYTRAVPLSRVLPELSKQTGLRFEADARTHELPVNPSVMVNVRLETALDLIVHQWPLPHYGYRINGDTVRFVYLGPPIGN